MCAKFEGVFDGTNTMFIQRGRCFGAMGQVIVRFLFRLKGTAFEKLNRLIEHTGVGNARDVAAGGVRQPEIVIREMSADAPACRGVPPVLHIAFAELMRGGAQEM